VDLIEEDSWMMEILRIVESLDLPDSWIGAGFVRSKVWDYLHEYKRRTPIPDIDVIYFDKSDLSEEKEREIEKRLQNLKSDVKWEVINQARMHKLHRHRPYKNSPEALSFWVETATCVGVRLKNGKVELTAPHGVSDLVNLILRPTKDYKKDRSLFEKRIRDKKWLEIWPKLKVV
jgi:hypothetical protein